jgi:preprotein translocase subunit SecY
MCVSNRLNQSAQELNQGLSLASAQLHVISFANKLVITYFVAVFVIYYTQSQVNITYCGPLQLM